MITLFLVFHVCTSTSISLGLQAIFLDFSDLAQMQALGMRCEIPISILFHSCLEASQSLFTSYSISM